MLVRESLYNFKRGNDPIQSSGLGVKALIQNFMEKIIDEKELHLYRINPDNSIDVYTDLELNLLPNIEELPDYIDFFHVYGSVFTLSSNLKSLKGFPKYVERNFYTNAHITRQMIVDAKIYVKGTII